MAKQPLVVPERVEAGTNRLPARTAFYRLDSGFRELDAEQRQIPFVHYVWIVRRHAWRIIACIAVVMSMTYIATSRLTPIYESTTTVDIEHQMPTGVVGQASNPSLDFDSDQFLSTQMRLIQSDSVLRPVAETYHLLMPNKKSGKDSSTRGGIAYDAPVSLSGLRVTRPANTLLLLVSYRSPDPKLAADVANDVARSYIERTYELRYKAATGLSSFMEKQLEELKAKMERSSAALAQFERELDVINPEEKTNILSARLLQLNTEYTGAQTDRLKKEATWNSVQSGSLEALEITSQGESLKRAGELLAEAEQKFSEVKTHYGSNHPEYRKAALGVADLVQQFQNARRDVVQRVQTDYSEAMTRETKLKRAVAETKAEFDHLNAHSFEYQAVKQQAEADKQLYEELVKKIKEASINAGFQDGSIRVADLARPSPSPVYPRVVLTTLIAFILATILATSLAILSDLVSSAVRDGEEVRNIFGMDVLGTLPLVRGWTKTALFSGKTDETALMKTQDFPARTKPSAYSAYEDAVRTLRNSILLSSLDDVKTLLITSASSGEGKTTTAVNLAISHARKRRKTLLIDADLRRPSVHKTLGIKFDSDAKAALSLVDESNWREHLIYIEAVPDLAVLPAANPSPDGVDVVGSRLAGILPEAESTYDLIIIDSPPLLGFPEPLEISVIVSAVLLVAATGETDRRALGSALTDLQRLRANVLGVVLNKVSAETSIAYYYSRDKYAKYYN